MGDDAAVISQLGATDRPIGIREGPHGQADVIEIPARRLAGQRGRILERRDNLHPLVAAQHPELDPVAGFASVDFAIEVRRDHPVRLV